MIETIHLQLLLATFAGWVGRKQTAIITYLIEENRVLKEQLKSDGRRLRFTDDQRRRLAAKGKPLGRKVLPLCPKTRSCCNKTSWTQSEYL
jgi:hypothetical protein